ncbi:thioredoxin domain-containing protein [Bythopirellula goksoeyrii]|uniref:Thioredoxin domain-containing protein n=1 Tax=Bythopirellula goksoeyrii TaxID=1400387 RepID=A0A5B9QJB2_9BACT|nr:hypothetical protein [Bythopirellula goksoeyrii]QEG34261.1 hypothetical protein Pr1d_15350 [Bythopirellula goksoeyrii]
MVEVLAMTAIALMSFGVSGDSAQWQSDYGKALAASQADSRPLLIVLDNPSDPATAASEDQLVAEGEQEELLNAYERCHVDVSTEYGKKVADAFKAKEFPFAAIIDKTGSVVLCKKTGKVSDEEWQKTLTTYQSGVKPLRVEQTSFFRGSEGINTSVVSPSYCPSCQKKAQQGY